MRELGNSALGRCIGAAVVILAIMLGMSQLVTACGGPAVACAANSNVYDDAAHKCIPVKD